ncbi:hypothetical protein CAPTEDRAFT_175326 [Capitella teleta]|uniref:Corrinoid adenosyltransferase MMAB n=1 Tax=Capitella teleta TaxID=283909 RepID=R7UTB5_CAPTE|nr:hypothetical protein CAPTEDRAFT_175326 [Capitella teleta]|eukprot:ELU09408.1 hypothetical protein CAPTEDRAFT_175326 [Capitella teleta]
MLSSGKPPRIYTRSGDKGTSSTFTGERRPKDDRLFEALGATDELNSSIGLAREFCEEANHPFTEKLEQVQCILQDIGSTIATPRPTARDVHLRKTEFSKEHIADLEKWIDEYTESLPPLTNFILPSGGRASASLHMARSICRRTERRVIPLVREGQVDSMPAKYLNRLSDFLFTVARIAAVKDAKGEKIYRRPNKDSEDIPTDI